MQYRPGEPDWEYTQWKLENNSATQILREISFDHFGAPKSAVLTIWANLNLNFFGNFDIFKGEMLPKIKSQSLF